MSETQIGDAIEEAAHMHEVLLENERVRVLEYQAEPGDTAALHTHPDGIIYHLEGVVTARDAPQGGEAHEFEINPGDVLWYPATAHVFEILEGDECRGLHIELKE